MRYFTLKEILLSVVLFSIFGIISGFLYFVFFIDKHRVKKIVFCGLYVLKSHSYSPSITLKPSKSVRWIEIIVESLYEFVFFTILGAIYILLLYVGCDGVFRAYTLIIALLFSYLSYCVIFRCCNRIVNFILDKVFLTTYSTLYVILYPPQQLLMMLIAKISPILTKIKSRARERKFKNLIAKKSNEQALILRDIF